MSTVRNLNPSDPGIISIAREFISRYKDLSLSNIIELAWRGDHLAKVLISNEKILTDGAERIPVKCWMDNESNTYSSYLYAVALAQRRLKREGDELVYLKRLIKKNFPETRWKEVKEDLEEISQHLYEKDEDYERNFYNYLIDKLTYLSLEKKDELESGEKAHEEESIDFGQLDRELTSGINGFIINNPDITDKICNLFLEALSTPWRVNDKK